MEINYFLRILSLALMIAATVSGTNDTVYHTMLYVKVLNYTDLRQSINIDSSSTFPGTCCVKMPLENCTHYCETVFSVCVGSCHQVLFNITYSYDTNRIYDGNYGMERLDILSIRNENITVTITETRTDLQSGFSEQLVVDSLTKKNTRPPFGSFWIGRHIDPWTFQNKYFKLTLEVKAFCESDWYSPRNDCADHIPTDDLHTIHYNINERKFLPDLDCKDEEISKINFITSSPYKYTYSMLQALLAKFIADKICSSTTYEVRLDVLNVRYNRTNQNLRVVFHSSCLLNHTSVSPVADKYLQVSDLKIMQALLFMSPFEERQYFIDPVERQDLSNTRDQGRFQLMFRLTRFSNPENIYFDTMNNNVKRMQCPSNGCSPAFYFLYGFNRLKKNIRAIASPVKYLSDCFGHLVNPDNSTEETGNTLLFHSQEIWSEGAPLEVKIYHQNNMLHPIGYLKTKLDVGVAASFSQARSRRFSLGNSATNMSVDIEMMVWCSNGYYGQNCSKICNKSESNCNVAKCKADVIDTKLTDRYFHCKTGKCNQGTCVCPPGLAGSTCGVVNHYTLPSDMNFHFNLSDTKQAVTCQGGFKGFNCDKIDYCSNNICEHGLCYSKLNRYSCACDTGYQGFQCDEDIDSCFNVTCNNSGTCIDHLGDYICYCVNGYMGNNCETDIDDCLNITCNNHGTCIDQIANYTCKCMNGYTGKNCETDIDDCLNITCNNHGTCIDQIANYTCKCMNGYTGKNCETDIDDCLNVTCNNHGTCIDQIANYACNCMNGYTGKNCETDIDDCLNVTCNNHGTCIDQIANYTCKCMNGYTGNNCETDIDDCSNVNCNNHGTCIDQIANYKCNCMNGYTGNNCEIDIDDCLNVTCNGHGTCIDQISNYTCTCIDGYTGNNCETNIDDCSNVNCNNHGTCIDQIGDYMCYCVKGYTGNNCETYIDDCSNVNCKNYGTCIDQIGDYICYCVNGYTGNNCETDIDDCSNVTCNGHGTCIDQISNYTCTCIDGYTGHNCETDIDDCSNVNCNNHGTCIDQIGDYMCYCVNGYTGNNCEIDIDDCSNVNCNNHGTCIDQIGDCICYCVNGYTGNDCETDIDDCSNVNCNNHGTCIDQIGDYICYCVNGYTGNNCETYIDDCWNVTCNNHGTCIDHIDGYNCSCFYGYTGKYCETDIDYCLNVTCYNHGTCIDQIASYTCNCLTGYTGKNCEIDVDKCVNSTCGSHGNLQLEDGIYSRCTSSGWNITVNMTVLKQLYPTITRRNIHFGDSSCLGREVGNLLIFQQGFGECLTNKRISGNTLLYVNDLFYAIYDPLKPFIIRQYKWTYTVECDVNRNEATSSHVHHDVDTHHTAITGHYNINMTFFKDVNFMNQLPGNPLHANVGDDIYVKVFTTATDWTIKMRLHTCYTKPSDVADTNTIYYLIKDGCEVDSNTHIISQSTHETKFMFQDFVFSSNREGLNIYCNATFCETKDFSEGCSQSCSSPGTHALSGK